MNISKENLVGELVAKDYRTASVFKNHGIDFCCKGGRSIVEVCDKKGLEPEALISELTAATRESGTGSIDFQALDPDLLADYIEKKHHRYVEQKIPELQAYLSKLSKVHGGRHPELLEIENLFNASAGELAAHMKKEELILFPYIRKMMKVSRDNSSFSKPPFGTVRNPIEVMMQEHDNEGTRFRKIAGLSNNYTAPQDGCTTYRVAFLLLKEFEEDLHMHIHLENNILFPKALELEKKYSYAAAG